MSRKQRIEITVETDQILLIRRRGSQTWCPHCSAQIELLTAEEASAAARVDVPTISRMAKEGQLHGQLFICLNSLLNLITTGETL